MKNCSIALKLLRTLKSSLCLLFANGVPLKKTMNMTKVQTHDLHGLYFLSLLIFLASFGPMLFGENVFFVETVFLVKTFFWKYIFW